MPCSHPRLLLTGHPHVTITNGMPDATSECPAIDLFWWPLCHRRSTPLVYRWRAETTITAPPRSHRDRIINDHWCQYPELTHNSCYRNWYRCSKEVLPKSEAAITRAGIKEYVEAVRGRYLGASKKVKGKVLDEFVGVVGSHRKSAVRLLGRRKPRQQGNGGRARVCKGAVVDVSRMAWEATDHLCSLRLQPLLPELIPVLRRHGNRPITPRCQQMCAGLVPPPLIAC